MTAVLDSWAWWAAETLLSASVQGSVIVAAVWLLCRRLTAVSASTRALLWWVAALGFVVALMPLPSLRIPLLPSPSPIVSIPAAPAQSPRGLETAPRVPPHTSAVATAHASRPDRSIRWWAIAAIVLWMAVLATHVVRLIYAYVRLRAVVRRSTPLPEDEGEVATGIAAALGLKRSPAIHVSDEIETPLVAGLARAIVLIPAGAIASLSPHERAMAIGHELAHIRRRDLLWAWAPAVAERLFFFHPLARLAAREYASERESACDALVLDTMNVAPHDYGRMLVRLGIAGANPVFTVGGSPPSVTSLRRRLDMLHDAPSTRSSRATIALVALIAMVALLPLRVVARTPASAQTAAAPTAPATPQTPARPVQTAKPQPAAPVSPASPARRAARPVTPQQTEGIEQAIAEQRRNMQQIEEALATLRADLEAIHARERESRLEQEQQQLRRTLERSQQTLRLEQSRARESNAQTTTQFLEAELRALTAEREETIQRLGVLAAQIDALRVKLDEARRAQEIESNQKRPDDKK